MSLDLHCKTLKRTRMSILRCFAKQGDSLHFWIGRCRAELQKANRGCWWNGIIRRLGTNTSRLGKDLDRCIHGLYLQGPSLGTSLPFGFLSCTSILSLSQCFGICCKISLCVFESFLCIGNGCLGFRQRLFLLILRFFSCFNCIIASLFGK